MNVNEEHLSILSAIHWPPSISTLVTTIANFSIQYNYQAAVVAFAILRYDSVTLPYWV